VITQLKGINGLIKLILMILQKQRVKEEKIKNGNSIFFKKQPMNKDYPNDKKSYQHKKSE